MRKRPSIADCALAHRKALGLTVENQAQQLELARSTIHSWSQRQPAWWHIAGELSPLAVLAQLADRIAVRSSAEIKLSAELTYPPILDDEGSSDLVWQVDADLEAGAVSAYGRSPDSAALAILQRLDQLDG